MAQVAQVARWARCASVPSLSYSHKSVCSDRQRLMNTPPVHGVSVGQHETNVVSHCPRLIPESPRLPRWTRPLGVAGQKPLAGVLRAFGSSARYAHSVRGSAPLIQVSGEDLESPFPGTLCCSFATTSTSWSVVDRDKR